MQCNSLLTDRFLEIGSEELSRSHVLCGVALVIVASNAAPMPNDIRQYNAGCACCQVAHAAWPNVRKKSRTTICRPCMCVVELELALCRALPDKPKQRPYRMVWYRSTHVIHAHRAISIQRHRRGRPGSPSPQPKSTRCAQWQWRKEN